jgi:site-specific recombinase XerD
MSQYAHLWLAINGRILTDYKEARGLGPGPLFLSKRKSRITGSALYALVKKYLFFADLKGSVHTLRHTCFTEMARKGVSLPVTRDIAGRAQIETTSYYAHSLGEDRRKAVNAIALGGKS